jgi:hypothetical protein
MSWHTEILNRGLSAYLKAEREQPYLLSLLLHAASLAPRALDRAHNYCVARAAEVRREARVEHAPYHVVLDPSDLCNLRCPLCVHVTEPKGRRRRLLAPASARQILDSLGTLAIRLDLFNWGEPLLNPHFATIVEQASRIGLYTRTSSHFSHDPVIDWDRIVASGLRYIVASVDGVTQAVYGRYRVGGVIAAVERNLVALHAAKARAGSIWPVVEWQFLVFRHNVAELAAARERAAQLGADVFRYGGARAEMGSKAMIDSAAGVARSAPYLLEPDHPLSEYDGDGAKRRAAERAHCRWLWGKVAVHADGGISPCWNGWRASHDFGGADDDPLILWQGDRFARARRTAEAGGKRGGALLCERCAHHRSFVPPPDDDTEPLLHGEPLRTLAAAIEAETGHRPAASVVEAVETGFVPSQAAFA